MAEYELPTYRSPATVESLEKSGLTGAVLLYNERWFAKVRWIIAAVFIITGVLGWALEESLTHVGMSVPYFWLWGMAGGLAILNCFFLLHIRKLARSSRDRQIRLNVWLQIICDLLVISILVYKFGSLTTFISFAYLFHIALACIFFPRRQSFLITVLAALMFSTVVLFELTGLLPSSAIIETGSIPERAAASTPLVSWLSALLIWFIVWYMVSTLSGAVRAQDQQLNIINERLIQADKEKNMQMLVTTHDLKAPFAGIESNIQVLKYQHWDDLPNGVKTIIEKIDGRAHMLRDRINTILVLGELKSKGADLLDLMEVSLKDLMADIVESLYERAEMRKVKMMTQIPDLTVLSDRGQLTMLFSNLISNGISYSHENGVVEIAGSKAGSDLVLRIQDHGIGIREDALPHIFDDYFRSKEASKFNKQSTGLGLAVVKAIAINLHLKISVQSMQDEGTTFIVRLPIFNNGRKKDGENNTS